MLPLLCSALCTLAPAQSPALPSAAVLPLQARKGVDTDTAGLLTGRLVATLRVQGLFSRVVDTSELEQLLGFEQQKQLLACDSQSCLAEIAGALGVDYLVSGSLGRLGDAWLVNLTLTNTRTVQAAGTVSTKIRGQNEEILVDSIESLTQDLVRDYRVMLQKTHGAPAAPTLKQATTQAQANPEESPGLAWQRPVLMGSSVAGLAATVGSAVVGLVGAAVSSGVWLGLFMRVLPNAGAGPVLSVAYYGGWGVLGMGMLGALVLAVGSAALMISAFVLG